MSDSAAAEGIVYLNGRLVPDGQAVISVHDAGFTLGDTVYEAIRTFGGQPFRLERHLERLYASLTFTHIDAGLAPNQLAQAVLATLEANRPHMRGDVWIYIYISRGAHLDNFRHYLPLPPSERPPTVVILCKPLPYATYAAGYTEGVHAVIPSTRHTPAQSLDGKLKTTSRMNLTLAEMETRQVDPHAWSILLDIHGNLSENKSSNIFIVRQGALYTPPTDDTLAGITREEVLELAGQLGMPAHQQHLQPYHLITADEAFFTATGLVILPITKVNGQRLGDGYPGPLTRRLLTAWGQMVGLDLLEDARRHAGR